MVVSLNCVLSNGPGNSPARQDISFAQGEEVTVDLVVVDAAGSAVDLAGSALYFTARSYPTNPTAAVYQQATIINAAGGLATITIDSTATSALAPYPYRYDVVLIDAAGEVRHVVLNSILDLKVSYV